MKKQLAVCEFEPLKKLFIDVYTLNKMKIQTMPHINPIDYQLRTSSNIPIIGMNLTTLSQKYTTGIELTTKGDFVTALDTFRTCLQSIPLLIIRSQKDQKELQEFIRKVAEYIAAMRIELERKKLVASVRFLK